MMKNDRKRRQAAIADEYEAEIAELKKRLSIRDFECRSLAEANGYLQSEADQAKQAVAIQLAKMDKLRRILQQDEHAYIGKPDFTSLAEDGTVTTSQSQSDIQETTIAEPLWLPGPWLSSELPLDDLSFPETLVPSPTIPPSPSGTLGRKKSRSHPKISSHTIDLPRATASPGPNLTAKSKSTEAIRQTKTDVIDLSSDEKTGSEEESLMSLLPKY